MNKAVVLLSGGLDSATTLYYARQKGFNCHCLIFDYGQRHKKEIRSAKKIADLARCEWQVVKINLPWRGSALLDKKLDIQTRRGLNIQTPADNAIPSTYVPARNIIFLSFALSCAEAIGAKAIFIGANAIDYSGYPDCRPGFFKAFVKAADSGTRTGVENKPIKILTPLINKTKSEIIKSGIKLGVPYRFTWSCYKGGNAPCGKCDSCRFRQKGFREAGLKDPIWSN